MTAAALLAALLLCSCGPDGVERLRGLRHPVDPSRSLGAVLGSCPLFSRVSWSATPMPDGSLRVRATGILDLDRMVGATSQGRVFPAQDRAALAKAGANLCYVLEYEFGRDAPEGRQTLQAVMIVTMDWTQPAALRDDAVLRELALGAAGPALITAATDAAAYSRARLSVPDRK